MTLSSRLTSRLLKADLKICTFTLNGHILTSKGNGTKKGVLFCGVNQNCGGGLLGNQAGGSH